VAITAASAVLGASAGLAFAGLSVVAALGMYFAEANGLLDLTAAPEPPFTKWGVLIANYGMIAWVLYLVVRGTSQALQRARRYAHELSEQRSQLEALVADRTRDLARRTSYLGAATAVAQSAASMLADPERLLSHVANLITQQFDFYHTGIFLVDPGRQWAELRAASSRGGQRMLAQGHRLAVGEQGIVGFVAGHGEPRIALDVGVDTTFLRNLDLPDTRSEMALPLRARGEVIGVLDVQSTEPDAFAEEDIVTLQALADHVALAVSSAQVYGQLEQSIEAERRAYGEVIGEAWVELLRARPDLGFVKEHGVVAPIGNGAGSETWPGTPSSEDSSTLSTPIRVRGHVIGTIDAQVNQVGSWTPEQAAMLEAIAEHLGQALESARLYQETRLRAVREQTALRIAERVRAATEMEEILRVASEELGRELGGVDVVLRLGTESKLLEGLEQGRR
jgi:GAF domain-containing protein